MPTCRRSSGNPDLGRPHSLQHQDLRSLPRLGEGQRNQASGVCTSLCAPHLSAGGCGVLRIRLLDAPLSPPSPFFSSSPSSRSSSSSSSLLPAMAFYNSGFCAFARAREGRGGGGGRRGNQRNLLAFRSMPSSRHAPVISGGSRGPQHAGRTPRPPPRGGPVPPPPHSPPGRPPPGAAPRASRRPPAPPPAAAAVPGPGWAYPGRAGGRAAPAPGLRGAGGALCGARRLRGPGDRRRLRLHLGLRLGSAAAAAACARSTSRAELRLCARCDSVPHFGARRVAPRRDGATCGSEARAA